MNVTVKIQPCILLFFLILLALLRRITTTITSLVFPTARHSIRRSFYHFHTPLRYHHRRRRRRFCHRRRSGIRQRPLIPLILPRSPPRTFPRVAKSLTQPIQFSRKTSHTFPVAAPAAPAASTAAPGKLG